MKIYTLIQTIKANSGSVWNGREICADTTRDKVLWGDAGQECTGIISTCYASPAVIKKAMELGCNFIVVHEALFWNHGDRTDWLEKIRHSGRKKHCWKRAVSVSGAIMIMFMRGSGWTVHCTMVFLWPEQPAGLE